MWFALVDFDRRSIWCEMVCSNLTKASKAPVELRKQAFTLWLLYKSDQRADDAYHDLLG